MVPAVARELHYNQLGSAYHSWPHTHTHTHTLATKLLVSTSPDKTYCLPQLYE